MISVTSSTHQPVETLLTTPCTRLSSAALDITPMAFWAMTAVVSLAVLITFVRWSNASSCTQHTQQDTLIHHTSIKALDMSCWL